MRVTLAQLDQAPQESPEALVGRLLEEAPPADLLVLPELALAGFGAPDVVRARALRADGPEILGLAALARRHHRAIAFGYAECDGGALYNSACTIGMDGTILAHARKMHLWAGYEQALFRPGARGPVFPLADCRLGILICYDLDFQEAARDLALRGADTILVLSATTMPYDIIPDAVVPARAYENGCNVIFADRGGVDGAFTFLGRSRILGPDGGVVAATNEAGFAYVSGEITAAAVRAWRAGHPALADRRRDLFPDPHAGICPS